MSDYVGAILAAGRGRRMGTLGEQYPKPLLPVANQPLIGHHLQTLRRLGISQVYVVVGHEASQIAGALKDGVDYGVSITYVEQGAPLGSAHAVGRLAPYIDGPFVLLLGDYYFSAPELARLLQRARASGGSAMAAKREPDRQALCEACALDLDAEGRILRIVEKPKVPTSDMKGCGIYALRPEFFDAVRRTPRTALRDEYELTIAIDLYVQAGHPLYAEEVIEWDMNFTRPVDILRCNLAWLEEHGRRELVGANVHLAPGTQLEQVIIGDDVLVAEPSALREIVVFRGVQMRGGNHMERALVTPAGLISCPEV
ncbi:MAG: sugar phosphate nucleotidyltransferase [Ardenticatenaceae bacterium]|nr:sugar phosphate nucleotidyltransferase [Ardenticatenaceae bacterium]HBY99604.1 hypothetical protein [Chloroflexota bacterium]